LISNIERGPSIPWFFTFIDKQNEPMKNTMSGKSSRSEKVEGAMGNNEIYWLSQTSR
jgi:hypothetical protein